jgi:hypothetical protein
MRKIIAGSERRNSLIIRLTFQKIYGARKIGYNFLDKTVDIWIYFERCTSSIRIWADRDVSIRGNPASIVHAPSSPYSFHIRIGYTS